MAAPDAPQQIVRRGDPDRYFTALLAPQAGRATLFTLYAFNHELARAPEVTREPTLALIRLQWWREVVEGASRAHEVATPLRRALAQGTLHQADLLRMIEARETEVEAPIADIPAWLAWLRAGAGSLAVAAGRALGAPREAWPRLRELGAGFAAAGQLRSIAAYARQGRCLLPASLLATQALAAEDVVANPAHPALDAIRATLRHEGRLLLGPPQPSGRDWIAAALPAVLARRDLACASPHPGPRALGDRLAVLAAAMRGRA